MRLIDADALIERIKPVAEYEYNDTRRKAFNEILNYVQKMPTAYDVEAVVAELEKNEYDEGLIVTKEAIEIVRNGGKE